MKRFHLIVAIIVALAPILAEAGHHHRSHTCGGCGCSQARKVCKLVPDVKKITKTVYSCECEDFCVQGRSKCVGTQQVCDCKGNVRCEPIMQPTCECIRTRVKLVKKPVTEEKKGWKCVVEVVCCGCGVAMNPTVRDATEVETQLALAEATRQGLLTIEAVDAVLLPTDAPVVVAIAADDAPETIPAPVATVKQTSFFGSLFAR